LSAPFLQAEVVVASSHFTIDATTMAPPSAPAPGELSYPSPSVEELHCSAFTLLLDGSIDVNTPEVSKKNNSSPAAAAAPGPGAFVFSPTPLHRPRPVLLAAKRLKFEESPPKKTPPPAAAAAAGPGAFVFSPTPERSRTPIVDTQRFKSEESPVEEVSTEESSPEESPTEALAEESLPEASPQLQEWYSIPIEKGTTSKVVLVPKFNVDTAMDELTSVLSVSYPVTECNFPRPFVVRELVLGKDFLEIVDALAYHCHVTEAIVAEYHRIVDLGDDIGRYDRVQLKRIEAIVAYVSGVFDYVTFSGIWEQIKTIHATLAASCGYLVNLGEPLSTDISTCLFGNFCNKEAVLRLLKAGAVSQEMKNAGNYGDGKTGLSFGQFTQEAPARFLEQAGFPLTAQQKSEPPKELHLHDAHEHVTGHCAEIHDFRGRDEAQKRDADAYCEGVNMLNSGVVRFMTCASTHIAQCLVSFTESGVTLGILGCTRFMPKVLKKFTNLGNNYETTLETLFCNFLGDPNHPEMCHDASKLSSHGSESLYACDRTITRFILNLNFVQRISQQHQLDVNNHNSDFFSWKAGISGLTAEDITKRDEKLVERAERLNEARRERLLEQGTLMQSTFCPERRYVVIKEDGTWVDCNHCVCGIKHMGYAPMEVHRARNWYQCTECKNVRIIDKLGTKVLCRNSHYKRGCGRSHRRNKWLAVSPPDDLVETC
jgi:hypothetical protein